MAIECRTLIEADSIQPKKRKKKNRENERIKIVLHQSISIKK